MTRMCCHVTRERFTEERGERLGTRLVDVPTTVVSYLSIAWSIELNESMHACLSSGLLIEAVLDVMTNSHKHTNGDRIHWSSIAAMVANTVPLH